jgi:hypothetical protein
MDIPGIASVYSKEKVTEAIKRRHILQLELIRVEHFIAMAVGLGFADPLDVVEGRFSAEDATTMHKDELENIRKEEALAGEKGRALLAAAEARVKKEAGLKPPNEGTLRMRVLSELLYRNMTIPEMVKFLKADGYETQSKKLSANVTAALHRMKKRGEVVNVSGKWSITEIGADLLGEGKGSFVKIL